MKETVIQVAVCGASGSGKSQLVKKLDNFLLTRPADKRIFRLKLTETSSESNTIFPDFDFALFAFEVTGIANKWDKWTDIRDLISKKYSPYSSKTCLVGTKLDLIALDSLEDVEIRCLPATVSYFARLKFIPTSVITGAGLQVLVLFIVDQLFPNSLVSKPWHAVFEDAVSSFLDSFAALFALPVPPNVNQDTDDVYEIIDDDAIEPLYMSTESLEHNAHVSKFYPEGKKSCSYRITPTLIAKPRNPLEWDSTSYARSHLNIPIPQPRYPHLKYWFVTDFIEGKPLLECWDSLSFFMRFRIACTLRSYFSQMRRLSRSTPGSPVGGHVSGFVFSSWGFYQGPFESSLTFRRWVEEATYHGWKKQFAYYNQSKSQGINEAFPPEPIPPKYYDYSLVLTHADINISNVVLSNTGVLWVIDWATCGFYPKWIEALGLYRHENEPKSWQYLRWLIVGRYPKQGLFWEPYFLFASDSYGCLDPGEQIII